MSHCPTGSKMIKKLRGLCAHGSQVFMGNSCCTLWKVFGSTVGRLSKLRSGKDRVSDPNYCPPVCEAVPAQTVAVQLFSALWELIHPTSSLPPSPFQSSDSPAGKVSGQHCSSLLAKSRSERHLTAVTRSFPGKPWLSYQLIQGIPGNQKPGILFPIPNKKKKELNNQGLSTKQWKHSSPASFFEVLQTSTPFLCPGALNC